MESQLWKNIQIDKKIQQFSLEPTSQPFVTRGSLINDGKKKKNQRTTFYHLLKTEWKLYYLTIRD